MKLTQTERKIIAIVKEEVRVTPKLIAGQLGLSEQHVRNLMANLTRFGFLNRIARGLYEKGSERVPELKKIGTKISNVHKKITKKNSR